AETNAPMTFERHNVSGLATGALVDGDKKHLELRSAVAITVQPESLKDGNAQPAKKLTGVRAKPVNIHSAQAVFDHATMRMTFSGGATAEQEQDIMSGDTMTAILVETKSAKPAATTNTDSVAANAKGQKTEVRGNSYLRSMSEG